MSDVPKKQFIEDIAIEMGTDPAYVEKDWFAVQLLKYILVYQSDFDFIFTGGTSLSKGYGLIDRFSEDLDFLVLEKRESNKGTRSSFKKEFIEYIKNLTSFSLDENSLEAFNKNKSFKFLVSYPKIFKSSPLRDDLKVEIKFLTPYLPLERRAIRSFVSEYREDPEETCALCVSPIEIAGDKLSALTWRILSCNRESKDYKPQIIRHLHDLAWLKEIIDNSSSPFKDSAIRAFERLCSGDLHKGLMWRFCRIYRVKFETVPLKAEINLTVPIAPTLIFKNLTIEKNNTNKMVLII